LLRSAQIKNEGEFTVSLVEGAGRVGSVKRLRRVVVVMILGAVGLSQAIRQEFC